MAHLCRPSTSQPRVRKEVMIGEARGVSRQVGSNSTMLCDLYMPFKETAWDLPESFPRDRVNTDDIMLHERLHLQFKIIRIISLVRTTDSDIWTSCRGPKSLRGPRFSSAEFAEYAVEICVTAPQYKL